MTILVISSLLLIGVIGFFVGFQTGEHFGYLDGLAAGKQEERLRAIKEFLDDNCCSPKSEEGKTP
jgi:hypothetical protein